MDLSLAELMSSLQAAEGIVKTQPSVHMTEKSSFKPKSKGKGQKNN